MTPPPPKKFEDEEDESSEEGEEDFSVGAVPVAAVSKKKWDDEEEADDILDSWDAAEDSDVEREKEAKKKAAAEKAAAEVAANKKSKTQRIEDHKLAAAAAKEAAAREAAGRAKETPAERRERERLMSLESDMMHAQDLFGSVGIGAGSGKSDSKLVPIVDPKDPTRTINLADMTIFRPTTKNDFAQLKSVLVPLLLENSKKRDYPSFMQDFAREICAELNSENIKLVTSKLTTLANEKMREEKDAQKGGKKKKTQAKAKLAMGGKDGGGPDITNYEDAGYGDFDDFM